MRFTPTNLNGLRPVKAIGWEVWLWWSDRVANAERDDDGDVGLASGGPTNKWPSAERRIRPARKRPSSIAGDTGYAAAYVQTTGLSTSAADASRAGPPDEAVCGTWRTYRAEQGLVGCVTMAVERTHAIELRHLRYFVAAAEHGSFRKASADTGIQHSAISRRIRDLEHRLGTPLFLRHSGGVCLTFAGQRFLRRARQILRNFGDGTEEIASIQRSDFGRVRIGIYSSIASGFLAELLGLYADRHPKVQIDLIEDNPADQGEPIEIIENAGRGRGRKSHDGQDAQVRHAEAWFEPAGQGLIGEQRVEVDRGFGDTDAMALRRDR